MAGPNRVIPPLGAAVLRPHIVDVVANDPDLVDQISDRLDIPGTVASVLPDNPVITGIQADIGTVEGEVQSISPRVDAVEAALPDKATTAAVAAVESALSAVSVRTDVLSALRFDPASPTYGAVRGAVSASQRTANTAAINQAASDAAAAGGTLVIKGDYQTNGTITVQSHLDGESGTITAFNTAISPALLIGTRTPGASVDDKTIYLPTVIQGSKAFGGGWTGTDTGVEIANAYSCHITTQRISNFSTNLWLSAYGDGCVYNDITLGHLENGKVNLKLLPGDAGGWVNQNTFVSGRASIFSGEGTNIPGTRHILIGNGANPVNQNVFLNVSIENNGPEYHVECWGPYNTFIQCRWEAAPAKVLFTGANAHGNVILYGYSAHTVQITQTSGALYNHLYSRSGQRIQATGESNGVLIVENASGSSLPAITVMEAGAGYTSAPSTAYATSVSANISKFKRAADAHPRVQLDGQNGRVWVSNGTAAPTAGMASYGAAGLAFTGNFLGFYGKTPVTQPVANPDTTGATLAQLETEVNELKAALRALGLIAT